MDFLQATSDAVMNQRSTIRHMRAEGAERVAAYHEKLAARKAEAEMCDDEGCDHYGTPHVCRIVPTITDEQVAVAFSAFLDAPGDARASMRAALEAAAGVA